MCACDCGEAWCAHLTNWLWLRLCCRYHEPTLQRVHQVLERWLNERALLSSVGACMVSPPGSPQCGDGLHGTADPPDARVLRSLLHLDPPGAAAAAYTCTVQGVGDALALLPPFAAVAAARRPLIVAAVAAGQRPLVVAAVAAARQPPVVVAAGWPLVVVAAVPVVRRPLVGAAATAVRRPFAAASAQAACLLPAAAAAGRAGPAPPRSAAPKAAAAAAAVPACGGGAAAVVVPGLCVATAADMLGVAAAAPREGARPGAVRPTVYMQRRRRSRSPARRRTRTCCRRMRLGPRPDSQAGRTAAATWVHPCTALARLRMGMDTGAGRG